jgi:acyl dehydratase
MMASRTLKGSPSMLPLYARAAASMIPGASRLPFVPGGGKEIPDVDLTLAGVEVDREKVGAYAKVCGFSLRDQLPVTYPHVLAFPLHMAAMADGSFPFGAVGLVHIENRIVQHRPIAIGEKLEIRVRATPLEPHPRGRTFAFVSEAFIDGELVWEDISRMLRRGGGGSRPATATHQGSRGEDAGESPTGGPAGEAVAAEANAEWRLGEDLGRRYAAVSGDRNPIHMHSLAAKPLGFPKAIAHGMWTKARCVAALEGRLPDSFSVEVRFRKPILLPALVQLASAQHGAEIDFAVRGAKKDTTEAKVAKNGTTEAKAPTNGTTEAKVAKKDTTHLEGRIRPVDDRRNPK